MGLRRTGGGEADGAGNEEAACMAGMVMVLRGGDGGTARTGDEGGRREGLILRFSAFVQLFEDVLLWTRGEACDTVEVYG